MKIKKKDS